MIKYFITRFYPNEKGFYELPEGAKVVEIGKVKGSIYVEALVPVKE